MQNLDLVILAGGKGTRVKKLLKDMPKPLVEVNHKPFIYYILNHFSKFNFNKIFILAGYKGQKIKKKFHKKLFNLSEVEVIIEKKPMDTGGALYSLKKKINNDFILSNGDSILRISKIPLLNHNTIFLTKNTKYKSNSKLNGLKTDRKKNLIISNKSNWMNGGVYFFKKSFLKHTQNKKLSLEKELLPNLISKKKIKGYYINGFFFDIGTPKNFLHASKLLSSNFLRPAVFLDRDGVINYDKGYTYKYINFKFKPYVLDALKLFKKKGYYIFIATNQAGIAKGYYKFNDFISLHKQINNFLFTRGLYIDDLKFCPYHPKATIKKFKKKTKYRKPGNLMILDLLKCWDVDINRSFMVGDKRSDLLAAKKSNIYFEYDNNNLYKQSLKIIKNLNTKTK